MKQTFFLLNSSGDSRCSFDTTDPAAVEAARLEFDALKNSGHLLYGTDSNGGNATSMPNYDPTVERVVASKPIVAG